MKRAEYYTGQKLHEDSKLTYLMDCGVGAGKRRAVFLCECGRLKESRITHVAIGKTLSCGCYRDNLKPMLKDGRRSHPLYKTWLLMVYRCYNEGASGYQYYGGRGISVCPEWRCEEDGLWNFAKDMGERPENYTLDRIDTDGDYEPSNCRWVNRSIQSYNKRIRVDNSSGVTGVSETASGEWKAYINIEGRSIRETFKTFEEALFRRKQLEMEYYGFTLNY